MKLTIVVRGTPAPQGSKRAFRNKHSGKIMLTESSDKVKPWRLSVEYAAVNVIEALRGPEAVLRGSWSPLTGSLAVSMTFSFVRPKGHWGSGRNSEILKASAPRYPAGRPDLSKLARSTEDALTGVVWRDDSQVVKYDRLAKIYVATWDEPDSLSHAGAVIRVRELSDGTVEEEQDAQDRRDQIVEGY